MSPRAVALLVLAFLLPLVVARCPNWCNKHGICTSNTDAGYCICENGFTGEDCGTFMCPKAYDPLTVDDRPNRRKIRLVTSLMEGNMYGQIEFTFGKSTVKFNADSNLFSSEVCEQTLKQLNSVIGAKCVRESVQPNGAGTYLITLPDYPLYPTENNFFSHNGNPALTSFYCNTSTANMFEATAMPPVCEIFDADEESDGEFPDYAECSRHGSCNVYSGVCSCERGFYGPACSDTTDDKDKVVHEHDGPFYSGTTVKINNLRSPSAEFNFLQMKLDKNAVTTFRGDGHLQHNGNVSVVGTMTLMHTGSSKGYSNSNEESIVQRDLLCAHLQDGTTKDNCRNDGLFVSGAGSSSTGAPVTNIRSQLIEKKSGKSTVPQFHLQAHDGAELAASLSREGDLFLARDLVVGGSGGNSTFSVVDGYTTMQHAAVSSSLEVRGSAVVEDSLLIGTGFALTPGGMTVDVESHKGTLFELRSRQEDFKGSLLEMHAAGKTSSMLKAVVNDETTFEISSGGFAKVQGMRFMSGGIEVDAGGIDVHNGGLKVGGGFTVSSGTVDLCQSTLEVSQIKSKVTGSSNEPVFVGSVANQDYAGTMIDITSNAGHDDHHAYMRIKNSNPSRKEPLVYEINGEGSVFMAGDAHVKGELRVESTSRLSGGVSFEKVSVSAGESIELPVSAAYVVIDDDGKAAANDLVFPTNPDLVAGQVLILSNKDADPTRNPFIPSQSTVLFVYAGLGRWVDVEALKSPVKDLTGVTSFEAANDLSIGENITFETGKLRVSQLPRYSIPVTGMSGLLLGSDKFQFNSKGTLVTPGLKANKLMGDLDANGNYVRNVIVSDSKLSNVSITAASFSLEPDSIGFDGKGGLGYFDENGRLSVTKGLTISEDGNIAITDLAADVNMHGFNIANTSITHVSIDADAIVTKSLIVEDSEITETGNNGNVVLMDKFGRIFRGDNTLDIRVKDNTLMTQKMGGFALTGTIDGQNNAIENIRIVSGSIEGLKELSLKELKVTGLERHPTTGGGKLVVADSVTNKLYEQNPEHELRIEKLATVDIVVRGGLDMTGHVISNAVLEHATLAPQEKMVVNKLQVSSVGGKKAPPNLVRFASKFQEIIVGDEEGNLKVSPGVGVATFELAGGHESVSLTAEGVISRAVQADRIFLSSGAASGSAISANPADNTRMSVGVVAADAETSELMNVDDVSLSHLSVSNADVLEVLSVGSLKLTTGPDQYKPAKPMQMPGSSVLLAKQPDGSVVTTSELTAEYGSVKGEELFVNSHMKLNGYVAMNALTFNDPKLLDVKESEDSNLQLLAVDKSTGAVSTMSSVRADEMEVSKLTASKSVSVTGSLNLHGVSSAPADQVTNILALDNTGKVVQTSRVNVQELDTSSIATDNLLVESSLKMKFVVEDLKSGAKDRLLAAKAADGSIVGADDIEVQSVKADSVTSDKISVQQLSVGSLVDKNAADDAGLSLIGVSSDGQFVRASHVSAVAIAVDSIHSEKHAHVGSLSISSIAEHTEMKAPAILAIDEKGKVVKASANGANPLFLSDISTDNLNVNVAIHASELYLASESEGAGGVLHLDSLGRVAVANSAQLEGLTASTADVGSVTVSKSLRLPKAEDRKETEDVCLSMLGVGANGEVFNSRSEKLCGSTRSPKSKRATTTLVTDNNVDLMGSVVVSSGNLYVHSEAPLSVGQVLAVTALPSKDSDTELFKVGPSDMVTASSGRFDRVDAEQAVVSSLRVDSLKMKIDGNASKATRPLILNPDGTVSAADEVTMTESSLSLLTAPVVEMKGSLKLSKAAPGSILGVSDDGLVEARTDLTLKMLQAATMTVGDVLNVRGEVRLPFVNTTGHALTVDKNGVVQSTDSMTGLTSVGGASAAFKSLKVANELLLSSAALKQKDAAAPTHDVISSVAGADDGTVVLVSSSDVKLKSVVAESVVVGGVMEASQLKLKVAAGGAGSSPILTVNPSSGLVEAAKSISVTADEVKIGDGVVVRGSSLSVGGDLVLPGVSAAGGVLSVDSKTGSVKAVRDVTVDSVSVAGSVVIGEKGSISSPKIVLSGSTPAAAAKVLVGISAVGELVPITADLKLEAAEVKVSDKLVVGKGATAEDVFVSSLATSPGLVAAEQKTGKLIAAASATMLDFTVTNKLQTKDIAVGGKMFLSEATLGGAAAGVVIKKIGVNAKTGELVLADGDKAGAAAKLEASESVSAPAGQFKQLKLAARAAPKAPAAGAAAPSVLTMHSSGEVYDLGMDAFVQAMAGAVKEDSFPLPQHASFKSLALSDGVPATASGVLVAEPKTGKIVSKAAVQLDSIAAGEMTVSAGLDVKGDLKLTGGSRGGKVEPAVMCISDTGLLIPCPGVSVSAPKDGKSQLKVGTLKVEMITSDVTMEQHKLSDVVITGAGSSVTSDVAVFVAAGGADLKNAESGEVLMRRQSDGKMVGSGALKLDAGAVKVNGELTSASSKNFVISKAQLDAPVVNGGTLTAIAEAEISGGLKVKQRGDFASDVVVGGSAYISGTVMGSGPYVDSSDIRLKTNITNITSTLDKVTSLQAVSIVLYCIVVSFLFTFCLICIVMLCR